MLFDFIFDDEHIPAAAKAHLGRLQIPTLKVAEYHRPYVAIWIESEGKPDVTFADTYTLEVTATRTELTTRGPAATLWLRLSIVSSIDRNLPI